MADTFRNVMDKTNPADRWYLIAPDNDNDLAILPRAVACSADGTIVAIDALGTSMSITTTAGIVLPIRPTRVGAASTGTFYALY